MKKDIIKNKIIVVTNWGLLFSLPLLLLSVNVKTNTTKGSTYTKKLSTSLITNTKDNNKSVVKEEVKEEKKDDDNKIEEKDNNKNVAKSVKVNNSEEVTNKNEPQKKVEPVNKIEEKPVNNVIATYTGTMSFYNANCTNCSGITATGVNVSDGRLYYNDSQYHNVRIVAAGPEIKKWSIIRIKNSSLGGSVLAIVLDRGGDIGLGRKFLIDMLTNSQENKTGINKNITVEVLRSGK